MVKRKRDRYRKLLASYEPDFDFQPALLVAVTVMVPPDDLMQLTTPASSRLACRVRHETIEPE